MIETASTQSLEQISGSNFEIPENFCASLSGKDLISHVNHSMSRQLRQQDAWPANRFATFLWLAYGLAEDILILTDLYKSASKQEVRAALARHVGWGP